MVNPAKHQWYICDVSNGRDFGVMVEDDRIVG